MPRGELHDVNHQSMATMDLGQNLEEKRAKREIANMNERRRMQNINAGFHSLRSLLPHKHDGEKLSKAAILQHTANYIYQLENELHKLVTQNNELKNAGCSTESITTNTNSPEWLKRFQTHDCPGCKRRKYENNHRLDIDSSPINGDGSSTESSSEQEFKINNNRSRNKNRSADVASLRKQLNKIVKELEDEKRIRLLLEEELQYLGKQTNRQSRPQLVEQNQDEVEVASESLEIEMHSCPASPPEMVIASTTINEHVTDSGNAIYQTSHFGQKQLVEQHRVQKQNAIALPIDVPFVAPHDVDSPTDNTAATLKTPSNVVVLVDSNNVMLVESAKQANPTNNASSGQTTQILQLVPNNPSSKLGGPTILTAKQTLTNNGTTFQLVKKEVSADQAKTSRQNLNTIVEAIRHLEGDYLFNETTGKEIKVEDDIPLRTTCLLKTTTKTTTNGDANTTKSADQQNDDRGKEENSLITNSKANIVLGNISTNNDNNNANQTATIVTVGENITQRTYQTTNSTATTDSPRPQIIHIQRPNVIVANSIDN